MSKIKKVIKCSGNTFDGKKYICNRLKGKTCILGYVNYYTAKTECDLKTKLNKTNKILIEEV